jgi:hypothetical protein
MVEVGQRLGVSEVAARQRVTRAVARLRRAFAASGIALTEPAAVERALQSVALVKAPAALAASAAAAVAGGGGCSSSIGNAALKMMGAASKTKAAIAACAVVVSVVIVSTVAILAVERGPAGAHARAAASQPVPPTAAPATSAPVDDQATDAAAELTVRLADVLLDIAKTYRKHDMAALKQCLFSDDSVQARLVLAKLEEEVNEWWLRRAWAATFPGQRSKVLAGVFGEEGHGDDDDFEAAANRLLESGERPAVADGDRASLALTDVDPHAVIMMYFRRIDGRWRLDLAGTFRATLGNASHPLTDQAMERAADGYIQRNGAIIAFSATAAHELETGVYETADSAETVLAERAKPLSPNSKINVWASHRK